jgi:7-carboxy-7-deazaguanine synthase
VTLPTLGTSPAATRTVFKLADLPFTPVEEIAGRCLAQAGDVELVVISGGEPLLQAAPLIELIRLLQDAGKRIEIETNGTIAPPAELVGNVEFRCSPKLASAGMPASRTINPEALQAMDAAGAAFKFVVTSPADLDEIDELVETYGLRDIWLMPEGRDAQTIVSRLAWVFDEAVIRGWSVTPRIHVLAHNDRRAV